MSLFFKIDKLFSEHQNLFLLKGFFFVAFFFLKFFLLLKNNLSFVESAKNELEL
jgi:hypothetical protein